MEHILQSNFLSNHIKVRSSSLRLSAELEDTKKNFVKENSVSWILFVYLRFGVSILNKSAKHCVYGKMLKVVVLFLHTLFL